MFHDQAVQAHSCTGAITTAITRQDGQMQTFDFLYPPSAGYGHGGDKYTCEVSQTGQI